MVHLLVHALALTVVAQVPAFDDESSLAFAARKGDLPRVQLLLDARPELVNELDAVGRTPLNYAAKAGHAPVVELILSHRPEKPDQIDEYGYTALHWAAMYAKLDAIRVMARHKLDINVRDQQQGTPLHGAMGNVFSNTHMMHPQVVELLLSLGADPSLRDRRGNTPLHTAGGLVGNLAAAQALVQRAEKLDVSPQNDQGETPLHQAAGFGRLDIVEFLLEHGANPKLLSKRGETPRDVALGSDAKKAAEISKKLAAAEMEFREP